MADFIAISQPRIEDLQRETENDRAMQILKSTILKGWPNTKSEVPTEISPYYQIRDERTVQNGERCVVPRSLRADIMARIPQSHIGVGCLRRARESVYWPGMTSAIKDYISQCKTCRSYETAQAKQKLCPHDIPVRPWTKVAVDIFEHDDRQYQVTARLLEQLMGSGSHGSKRCEP